MPTSSSIDGGLHYICIDWRQLDELLAAGRDACGFRGRRCSHAIRPPLRDRKFADSPLEEDGFEPSVPPRERDGSV